MARGKILSPDQLRRDVHILMQDPLARLPNNVGQNIVDFDGLNDPTDPRNFSPLYKWSVVGLISVMSLVVNLAILMCAPATPRILEEFNSTSKLASTILISIWELGEVLGPLIVAPLCELHGRLPVYHISNILFIVFSIVAACSTSINMLIGCRFVLGSTVASTVLNTCIVGDMFTPSSRGRALALMGIMPFIAPVCGPIIGGVVSEAAGWRWTFWLTAIMAGTFEVLFLLLYRETYSVAILRQKTKRLRLKTGNLLLRSRHDGNTPTKLLLTRAIFRPLTLLVVSPVVLLVAICCALDMSYVYIIITNITGIYEQTYGFSERLAGFTYLGLGIGMVLSAILTGTFLDWYIQKQKALGYPDCPENRLPPMCPGNILAPAGLVAFGWAVQHKTPWVVPILCSAASGFGFVMVNLAAWCFLVDIGGIYVASATAGVVVLRNITAAGLPLAGPPLFDKLGLGWGTTILGCFGFIFAPIPLILMRWSGRLREKGKERLGDA